MAPSEQTRLPADAQALRTAQAATRVDSAHILAGDAVAPEAAPVTPSVSAPAAVAAHVSTSDAWMTS
jgi:hypothetical protein